MRKYEMPKITVETFWTPSWVREMCVKHGLYTWGNCEEYGEMFDYVREHREPTEYDLYQVAVDIADHSSEQTVENVMFLLRSEAIKSFYTIDN